MSAHNNERESCVQQQKDNTFSIAYVRLCPRRDQLSSSKITVILDLCAKQA